LGAAASTCCPPPQEVCSFCNSANAIPVSDCSPPSIPPKKTEIPFFRRDRGEREECRFAWSRVTPACHPAPRAASPSLLRMLLWVLLCYLIKFVSGILIAFTK